MTVFAFDCASDSMRGELTRWFVEIKPGVFVGKVNTRISNLLWERFSNESKSRGGVRIESAKNEQGYRLFMYGTPYREVVDYEGIQLIKRTGEQQQEEDLYVDDFSLDI